MSPPQAKSPPAQHQNLTVELKTTATPPQDDEAIPQYVALTKIQRVPCATYPLPLPSPKNDWEYADDDDNYDIPFSHVKVKWYNSDEDSYSSCCPKNDFFAYDKNLGVLKIRQIL